MIAREIAAGGCTRCDWIGEDRYGWSWWVIRRAVHDARVHLWMEHSIDWRKEGTTDRGRGRAVRSSTQAPVIPNAEDEKGG